MMQHGMNPPTPGMSFDPGMLALGAAILTVLLVAWLVRSSKLWHNIKSALGIGRGRKR